MKTHEERRLEKLLEDKQLWHRVWLDGGKKEWYDHAAKVYEGYKLEVEWNNLSKEEKQIIEWSEMDNEYLDGK